MPTVVATWHSSQYPYETKCPSGYLPLAALVAMTLLDLDVVPSCAHALSRMSPLAFGADQARVRLQPASPAMMRRKFAKRRVLFSNNVTLYSGQVNLT